MKLKQHVHDYTVHQVYIQSNTQAPKDGGNINYNYDAHLQADLWSQQLPPRQHKILIYINYLLKDSSPGVPCSPTFDE